MVYHRVFRDDEIPLVLEGWIKTECNLELLFSILERKGMNF